VFYHIPYPSAEELLEIVSVKLEEQNLPGVFDEDSLRVLLARFDEMRRELDKISAKRPATAELINWLVILHRHGLGPEDFADQDKERRTALSASLSVVAKSPEALRALRAHFGLPDGIND
jgi:MoxR-like ATPase